MVNGSSHMAGATYRALATVEGVLAERGLQTDWFNLGNAPVRGCLSCEHCAKTHRCVFRDDVCNELIEGLLSCDGVVVGSPVFFAGPNSALCALMDRAFYATCRYGHLLRGKPAAAVASMKRVGATSALAGIERYFTYAEMPVISTPNWAAEFREHSTTESDTLGERRLKRLGENMADAVLALGSAPAASSSSAPAGVPVAGTANGEGAPAASTISGEGSAS